MSSTRQMRRRLALAVLGMLFSGVAAAPAFSQERAPFEIREWSVWLSEPGHKVVNGPLYPSLLPGVVESNRSRLSPDKQLRPSPVGFLSLHGSPPEFVDIDLRLKSGKFLAHWPPADTKNNRLRWLNLNVSIAPAEDAAAAFVAEGHWFHEARKLEALYLAGATRPERFLVYDVELTLPMLVRVDGGPEEFRISNGSSFEMLDVLLIMPEGDGARVGWLDHVSASNPAPRAEPQDKAQPETPAGPLSRRQRVEANLPAGRGFSLNDPRKAAAAQPARPEVVAGNPDNEAAETLLVSSPLSRTSDEYAEKTAGELTRRLEQTGLGREEIDLMLSLYRSHFFESEEAVLLFRLAQAAVDDHVPLVYEPETARVRRTALVLLHKVDPRLREEIDRLIVQLGDAEYKVREQAEQGLARLGRLAVPALRTALQDPDLEVVLRAERLLLSQNEAID